MYSGIQYTFLCTSPTSTIQQMFVTIFYDFQSVSNKVAKVLQSNFIVPICAETGLVPTASTKNTRAVQSLVQS